MTIWANVMIGFAIVLFLGLLLRGWIKYSDNRARNVIHAERAHRVDPFVEVIRSHPEIVKVSRLDRHPWFIGPHVCVFAYTMCIFTGAPLTSNVTTLGATPRYTMGTCFLIGSTLVMLGALMGAKIRGHVIAPDVRAHLTSAVLGDDIVFPYRLSMAGMGAMIVSSGIYAWTSFQSTTGSLGGWLTVGIAALCVLSIPWFYVTVRRFQKWDHILISEAQARVDSACDVD